MHPSPTSLVCVLFTEINLNFSCTSVLKMVSDLFVTPFAFTRRNFPVEAHIFAQCEVNSLYPYLKQQAVSYVTAVAITVHSGRRTSWWFLSFENGSRFVGFHNKSIKPTSMELPPGKLTSPGSVIIKVSHHIPARWEWISLRRWQMEIGTRGRWTISRTPLPWIIKLSTGTDELIVGEAKRKKKWWSSVGGITEMKIW
jgi:hypothetical protein